MFLIRGQRFSHGLPILCSLNAFCTNNKRIIYVRKIFYIVFVFVLIPNPYSNGNIKRNSLNKIQFTFYFHNNSCGFIIIPLTQISILMRFRHSVRNNECAENRVTYMIYSNRLEYDQFTQNVKPNIQIILKSPIQ